MHGHFADGVRFKLKPEEKKITVSIKLNEETVIVRSIPVEEFKIKLEQIQNEIKEMTG